MFISFEEFKDQNMEPPLI